MVTKQLPSTQPADVNSSQWQAITYRNGHLLIVAGPGTGKTHTLTYRIVHTAYELPVSQKILAITFTHKAAEEMRQRVESRMGEWGDRMLIGTFHQFCVEILRKYVHISGLPRDFSVASEEETDRVAKKLWPDVKNKERKNILTRISQWKSNGYDEPTPAEAEIQMKSLRMQGVLDFDDLLFELWRLLRGHPDVLQDVRGCYSKIFVDEYQDVNRIQHALLKMIVGKSGEITAIGDPNQAIYGFRGSDVRLFDSFVYDFHEARILTLSENYRSAEKLLTASGQIMSQSNTLHVPKLTANIYAGGHLVIHEAVTDKAEAEYVVHQIERMVGGTSMFSQDSGRVASEDESERSFGDVAILYRLNSQRYSLQKAFDRSGIPYQVSGAVTWDEEDDVCPSRYVDINLDVEKVSLMTLHAAKGLEFPVVFIVGCEQSIIPLQFDGLISDKEEERRLFYVGMTRAKERLTLVRARRRVLFGKSVCLAPSEFLADIEEDLKEYDQQKQTVKKRKKDEDQMSLF